MTREITYQTIKSTILSYFPDARILLFGSHARGDSDNHSDYDLLVITPGLLSPKEKLSRTSQLHKIIIKAIHAPVDLLMYSEAEIIEKETLPGHIVRTAIREGITL